MIPHKIKDIEVKYLNVIKGEIKIGFTAPDHDSDSGREIFELIDIFQNISKFLFFKGLFYDIKCSYDPIYLLSYNNHTSNGSGTNLLPITMISSSFNNSIPNRSGFSEEFVVDTTRLAGETFSIKIRLTDSSEIIGEWSNILTVKLTDSIKFSSQIREFNHSIVKLKYFEENFKSIEAKEKFYSKLFIGVLSNKNFNYLRRVALIFQFISFTI